MSFSWFNYTTPASDEMEYAVVEWEIDPKGIKEVFVQGADVERITGAQGTKIYVVVPNEREDWREVQQGGHYTLSPVRDVGSAGTTNILIDSHVGSMVQVDSVGSLQIGPDGLIADLPQPDLLKVTVTAPPTVRIDFRS